MKTVIINNQKGGVGKTTLACHLAWSLAEDGARVALLDFDTQANASFVFKEVRQGPPASRLFLDPRVEVESGEGVTLFPADKALRLVERDVNASLNNILANHAGLDGRFDYVVIDTPPTLDTRSQGAFLVSDGVVVPIELEQFSMLGLRDLGETLSTMAKLRGGRRVPVLGIVASRFVKTQPRQRANLQEVINTVGAAVVFPPIRQAQAYAEAIGVSQPVWKLPGTAAREAGQEMKQVLATIKAKLDGRAVPAPEAQSA